MEQNTNKISAPIFIETRENLESGEHITYEKEVYDIDELSVIQHMSHNFSGILFYIGLQMCWLPTAKYGLFSPFGLIGAFIALFALWRMIIMILKRIHQRMHPLDPLPKYLYRDDDMIEEASDMLKEMREDAYAMHDKRILSLKEFRRLAH